MAVELNEDENNHLKSVKFRRLNVIEVDHEEEEEEEEMDDEEMEGEDNEEMNEGEDGNSKKKKRRGRNLFMTIDCKVFITCGHKDVDPDVFNAIHNNGLVYNG